MPNPKNSTTTSRGRTYKWRDEVFDSVTTIINGGIPKPALKAWGERTVAEFAFDRYEEWKEMERDEAVDWLKRSPFRATDKAAVKGSDVHEWAEQYVLGHAPAIDSLPLTHRPYAQQFLRFLEDFQPEFEATEFTCYSRTYGYAGTGDWLARIKGHGLVLGDNKTGKGVYGETACQLASYERADFIGLPDGTEAPMPQVDECMVLHLTAKDYSLIPVVTSDEVFETFLKAKAIRDFCNNTSKEVLGAPLPAPLKVVA